jgi:formylglycine-generating enzyme required for sulfatase activity
MPFSLTGTFVSILIGGLALLSGAVQAQDTDPARKKCVAYGFQEHTPSHERCVKQVLQSAGSSNTPAKPVPAAGPGSLDAQKEDEFWKDAKAVGNRAAFEAYLDNYPKGRYAGLARANMERFADSPTAQPKDLAEQKVAGAGTAKLESAMPRPGQIIKDCADCPEMVMIPAGSFEMGSPDGEKDRWPDGREGPVHKVAIGYTFALGKHELTRGEFARFVNASSYKTQAERSQGCFAWDGKAWALDASKNWRNPGFAQADNHPVVCVSWNDAQAYLAWLNEKVPGKAFRLPSEAEWEYAARAGQGGKRFPWGDDLNYSQICEFANGMDMDTTGKAKVPGVTWTAASCSDGYAYTAPAGSLKPNAFGLYDMHGNAWEWVQDQYHENYQGAPADGSAWVSGGEQARRVLRGGAWYYDPRILRSAGRIRYAPDGRIYDAGMRIARTL